MTNFSFDKTQFYEYDIFIEKNSNSINATNFCNKYNLDFYRWLRKKSTKTLVGALSASKCCQNDDLLFLINDGQNKVSIFQESLTHKLKIFLLGEDFLEQTSGYYLCKELFLDLLFKVFPVQYTAFLSKLACTSQEERGLQTIQNTLTTLTSSFEDLKTRTNYQYLPLISNNDFKKLVENVTNLTKNVGDISRVSEEIKKVYRNEATSCEKINLVLEKQSELAKWFWAQLLISAAKTDEL